MVPPSLLNLSESVSYRIVFPFDQGTSLEMFHNDSDIVLAIGLL